VLTIETSPVMQPRVVGGGVAELGYVVSCCRRLARGRWSGFSCEGAAVESSVASGGAAVGRVRARLPLRGHLRGPTAGRQEFVLTLLVKFASERDAFVETNARPVRRDEVSASGPAL